MTSWIMLNTTEFRATSGREPLKLGTWLLEDHLCRLTRGDEELQLEPKIAALLAALVKRSGEPVTRDELMQEIWGHLHVTDDALNRLIGRLRKQLQQIDDGIAVETLPRVGYRLRLPMADSVATRVASAASADIRWSSKRWLAVAVVGIVCLLGLLMLYKRSQRIDPAHLVAAGPEQITTLPGMEINPAFAPNGSLYFSHRDPSGFWQIYRRDSDAAAPVRLTNERAHHLMPVWRADGRGWAFLRRAGEQCEVLVWMIGQTDPQPVAQCGPDNDESLDWSPAGDKLVFSPPGAGPSALAVMDLASRQQSVITQAQPSAIGDAAAKFSPDGKRLAFVRWADIGVADVFVMQIADGSLRQVTTDGTKIHGLAWLGPDQLVFASDRAGSFLLWLVDLNSGRLQPVTVGTDAVANPALRADGRKLVFESWTDQSDIMTLSLRKSGGTQPRPLVQSTRWDWGAKASPAGERLAFVSDRSGSPELWISRLDGTKPRRVTRFDGPYLRAVDWSPDGDWLAVEVTGEQSFDIFLVDGSGDSPPQALVVSPFPERGARWSPDGRAIYFGRKTGSSWSLHRVEIDSGAEQVVSADAGTVALEDVSGRYIYFTDCLQSGFWRKSTDTGEVEKLLDYPAPLDCQNWTLIDNQAYLLRRIAVHDAHLHSYDVNGGRLTRLRQLPNLFHGGGLAIHARQVFYTAITNRESDLMAQSLSPSTTR